ncbi:DUF3419 family protein [Nocardiopsis sp. L17-MgMaSL7]|uniref:DUF3419 family protein n=1 Tax=Nocardiopsis sp. L17-MgMaSL7 TaxID=1938893 RepID=UPI000D713A4A|nr:DUF3419 family protein [Nocardiopsis sp. L17-MgMaSL7]PWV58097.1 S-adenosylmethionine-diacylglycerol 3-amino-3-carboxypropyl transferase [Nocardiopsis sp. L17-MgMaSL7]
MSLASQIRKPFALGDYRAPTHERQWLTKGAILYSTCDEDSWSELQGLDIGPGDDVLSITGSGCRSLNLLIGGPRTLVSVDGNPLQNYLMELKVEGIRALECADFRAFMGVDQASPEGRVEWYEQIRPQLSTEARAFWDLNRAAIGEGVIYSGAHERFYATYIGPVVRLLRAKRLRQMYQIRDLSEHQRFYETKWDHAGWRAAVRLLARPKLIEALLGDPSYFAQVSREGPVADYLLDRLRVTFGRHLARDNHLFTLLVFGRYLHDEAVPPYLSPTHYETIRKHVDAVSIVTQRLDHYLESLPSGEFSKFSLSDISGWTSPAEFTSTLREVARTGRPGGRLCYRNLFTDRPLAPELSDVLQDIPELSRELTENDIAFAFTFVVASILGVPDTEAEATGATNPQEKQT